MDAALRRQRVMAEHDQRLSDAVSVTITETVDREHSRLRNFIRSRVADREEAEDILQDVFYELVEAYRLMKPVEQVTAWLFRVARNRITDLFRSKQRAALRGGSGAVTDEGEMLQLEEFLPSSDAGPDALYARSVLLDELDAALDELPEEQREVFIAHQLMGQSYKELSTVTGVSVNTLISRKHYAVLYLRERLQEIHDEFIKP